MTKEQEKLRDTLRKLFAMLGSPNEHEKNVARQKIDELAAKHNLSWNDVLELVGMGGSNEKDNDGLFDEFMRVMKNAGKKQSDILIELADAAKLFRSPEGRIWAEVFVKGHREIWPLRSSGFKGWLRYRYWEENKTSPGQEPVDTCLSHLEAKALFGEDTPIRETYLRVAGLDDKIYLDLCNDDWSAVEVDASGWRIVKEPPVRFFRDSGMKELPTPVSGGSLSELRTLLHVDDDGFLLIVAWVLGALRGKAPYPVLCMAGPAGASKSTAVCFLRDLIDPGKADPGALPREVRDLAISSSKRFVIGYDNLSGIPVPISDMLCRLSTGGGFTVRQLYSDDDEVTFSHTRPCILAGIEDVAGRHDLADRTIGITLEPIPEQSKKLLARLKATFRHNQPQILGRLLDIVSAGFKNLPNTRLDRYPRLADFVHWMHACEVAEWPPGTFARALAANKAALAVASFEADTVATHIIELLNTCGVVGWSSTSKDLLTQIDARATDQQKRAKGWPQTPHAMAGRVRRATEILRGQGWQVAYSRSADKHHARIISFTPREATETSETSERPNANDVNDLDTDISESLNVRRPDPHRPTPPRQQRSDVSSDASSDASSADNTLSGNGFGRSDVSDDVVPDWGEESPSLCPDEPTCRRCGVAGNVAFGQLIRANGGHYHPRCWSEERTRGPRKQRSNIGD